MSLSEWLLVKDNPRQRDTAIRAVKAQRYLKHVSPEHAIVHAARLPNGQLIKLDGHTRAYLWKSGRIQCPERITCVIVDVESMDQACELYWHYDSRKAVKTPLDLVCGVLAEERFQIATEWLKRSLNQAVRLIEGVKDADTIIRECMPLWFPEIQVVDSFADRIPKQCRMAGVVSGLMLRANDDRLEDFVEALGRGGTCIAGNGDGPFLLRTFVERRSIMRQTSGLQNQQIIARSTVKAIDLWKRGDFARLLRYDDWVKFAKKYRRYAIVSESNCEVQE